MASRNQGQESIGEIVGVVVRVVANVVDLVEDENGPLGIRLQGRPESSEDAVEALVGLLVLAGHLEEDFVGGAEPRPTPQEVDVLDSQGVLPGGEFRTEMACRHRLACSGRAVDQEGGREIPLVDAVEQARQLAFLLFGGR